MERIAWYAKVGAETVSFSATDVCEVEDLCN